MAAITPEAAAALIRQRRAVFPKMYDSRPIPKEIIEEVLENANWAPTHRHTEPWRFQVFRGDALRRLGEFLAGKYKDSTPAEQLSDMKFKKMLENPQRAGAVIAICMQRDLEGSVPEWEEIAATACAVQNMWLTCTAYGIGAYWSTPGAILRADEWLGLHNGERCLGLFYMGYYDTAVALPAKRRPVEDKTVWINA